VVSLSCIFSANVFQPIQVLSLFLFLSLAVSVFLSPSLPNYLSLSLSPHTQMLKRCEPSQAVVAGCVAAAGFGFVRRFTVTTKPFLLLDYS